jgi:hypothetical protein
VDIQCPTAACITTCKALSKGLNGALPRVTQPPRCPGRPLFLTSRNPHIHHAHAPPGVPNPSSDQPWATLPDHRPSVRHTHLFLARGCLHTRDLSLHGLRCRPPWLVQFHDCLYSDVTPSAGTKRWATAPSAWTKRRGFGGDVPRRRGGHGWARAVTCLSEPLYCPNVVCYPSMCAHA